MTGPAKTARSVASSTRVVAEAAWICMGKGQYAKGQERKGMV
jgi:hypothetical protein